MNSDTPITNSVFTSYRKAECGPSLIEYEMGSLECQLIEAHQAISDLNQRLIERQESFQAQLIRIEDAWREKLSEAREDAKKLRDALDDAISLIDRCSIDETPGDFHDTHKAINDVLNSTAKLLP